MGKNIILNYWKGGYIDASNQDQRTASKAILRN